MRKAKMNNDIMQHLTPTQIVKELDKYIIGQDDAKRAVAIALRNRWRRQKVEVKPKLHEGLQNFRVRPL